MRLRLRRLERVSFDVDSSVRLPWGERVPSDSNGKCDGTHLKLCLRNRFSNASKAAQREPDFSRVAGGVFRPIAASTVGKSHRSNVIGINDEYAHMLICAKSA